MEDCVRINGYLLIDKNGERIYSRYFDAESNNDYRKERKLEYSFFTQAKKIIGEFSKEKENKDIEIFYHEDKTILFKTYFNFFLFIFSEQDENEIIMREIMNVFNDIINDQLKNKNTDYFFKNYAQLIVYFDDILDNGYVLNLNSSDILKKRNNISAREIKNEGSSLKSAFNFGKSLFGR